jgi:hypothetical protein
MIFRFALDPSVLIKGHNNDNFFDETILEQHKKFLDTWLNYGTLVTDPDFDTRLRREIKNLSQDIRKRWQRALTEQNRYRIQEVPRICDWPLWEANTGEDVQSMDEEVKTVFVDQSKKNMLRHAWIHPTEICSFQAPSLSSSLNEVQRLDNEGISPMPREVLWSHYFEPLASQSRNVVLVDRYAIHRWLDFVPERETDIRHGLDFLIRKISELPNPTTVKVIGAAITVTGEDWNGLRDLQARRFELVKQKMERYSLGNIRKLIFILLPNNVFRDEAHFRFMRFDKLFISTDKGASTFDVSTESPEVSSAILKRYTYPDNVCALAERELDKHGMQPHARKVYQ